MTNNKSQMVTVDEARSYYGNNDAVHDFDHVLRVLALAERIGQAEGADMEVVRAAVLLHDVGRARADADGLDHATLGATQVREILAGQPPAKVEAVAHAIAAHRYRAAPEPETLEAQVLFDADKLDAIGAVGVARAFAYGGAHGQRLWVSVESVDAARWKEEGDDPDAHTPIHEFVVKLSKLKSRLFTPTGHAIAEERHAFMVSFFERMDAEIQGSK
ncbi:MAG: HD domain-containing protein [Anaerolineae bacterium]|nr:HD domain-containing protein [Anaerolineae bacterium]